MKKIIIILITILSIFSQTYANEWRAINLSISTGTEINPPINSFDNNFIGGSASIHWDINQEFFIQGWNGIFHSFNREFNDWFSSELTINRRFNSLKSLSIGTGIQYVNDFNGYNPTFAIFRVQKTFKLN